jgi:hypothetical protein
MILRLRVGARFWNCFICDTLACEAVSGITVDVDLPVGVGCPHFFHKRYDLAKGNGQDQHDRAAQEPWLGWRSVLQA